MKWQLATLLLLSSAVSLAAQPQAQVYWFDGGINQANLDGSNIHTPIGFVGLPLALAADEVDGKIYWSSTGGGWISRSNPDGSGFERVVYPALDPSEARVVGMAVDAAHRKLYWIELPRPFSDRADPLIKRSNLDGSVMQTIVSAGLKSPLDIAVDPDHERIYWTDRESNTIESSDLDGANPQTVVTDSGMVGVALDRTHGMLYWSAAGRINRANLDGSSKEVILEEAGAGRISFDAQKGELFWLGPNPNSNGFDITAIYKSGADGSQVETIATADCSTVGCFYPPTYVDVIPTDIEVLSSADNVYFTYESCCVLAEIPDGLRISYIGTDGSPRPHFPGRNPNGVVVNAASGQALQYSLTWGWGSAYFEVATLDGRSVVGRTFEGSLSLFDLLIDPLTSEVLVSINNSICAYDGSPRDAPPPWPGDKCSYEIRPSGPATSIALDAGSRKLFWTSDDGIYSSIIGSNEETKIQSIAGQPTDIAFDSQSDRLYWREGNTIKRMPTAGGAIESLVSGSHVTSMALHPQDPSLYWLDGGRLYRANLDGSDKTALWAAGVDGTDLFVVGGPGIAAPSIPILSSPGADATSLPNSLLLQWQESSNASGYVLEVAEEAGFTKTIVSQTQQGTEFDFVSPSVESEFYWRVRAYGSTAISEWSEVRHFSTGLEGPLVVSAIAPADGAEDVPIDVDLVWKWPWHARWFRLQVSDDDQFESTAEGKVGSIIIDEDGFTDTTYSVVGLGPSQTYYWRVAGVDGLYRFTFGPVLSFTTADATGPTVGPVSLISPAEGSTGEAAYTEFSWRGVEGADRYHIQVEDDARFLDPVVNDSVVTDTTYTPVDPLAYGGRYFWRVRAGDQNGFGPWSSILAFTVAPGTAVEDIASGIPTQFALHVNYPNPFNPSTVIVFDLPESTEVSVRVYDLSGRRIAELVNGRLGAGRYRVTFDASALPSGAYLYRLDTTSYSETRRLVVVR